MTTSQSQQKTIVQLYPDGNQWCALIGINIVEGTVGFGDTPSQAIEDLKTQIDRWQWKNAIVQVEAGLLDKYDLFAEQEIPATMPINLKGG
jgi:hypothetical protein